MPQEIKKKQSTKLSSGSPKKKFMITKQSTICIIQLEQDSIYFKNPFLFRSRVCSSAWIERDLAEGLLSLEKRVSLEIRETTIQRDKNVIRLKPGFKSLHAHSIVADLNNRPQMQPLYSWD